MEVCFAGLIQVAFDSGLRDGRVLVECCQSESRKGRDMTLLEGLIQSGEGQAEEGSMCKCHEVSGGGATKCSIGMEGTGGLSHIQFPKFCCRCVLTL